MVRVHFHSIEWIKLLFCWGGEGSLVFLIQDTSTYALMQDVRCPVEIYVWFPGWVCSQLFPPSAQLCPFPRINCLPPSPHSTLLPAFHLSAQDRGFPCSSEFSKMLSKNGNDSFPISLIQQITVRWEGGSALQSPGWRSAAQQMAALALAPDCSWFN